MSETLRRTQVLLEPEQHKALKQLAQREQRSLSDLIREMLDAQLQLRQQDEAALKQRRLEALERIRRHRDAILERREGVPLEDDVTDVIHQIREERDAEINDGA